jgi:UDP-N-acetyl-D-mannosaminuronic acid transferase (WecB/TagA/CpsF family)
MEWFFRLVSEPKRLWPRYRQYPRFVWLVIRELLRKE